MQKCKVCSADLETRRQVHSLRENERLSFEKVARITGFSLWSVWRHLTHGHAVSPPVFSFVWDHLPRPGLPPRRGWYQPR